MKTTQSNKRADRSYIEAVTTARKLQADLINLVDEILLADWNDAGACSDRSREIMNVLLDLDSKSESVAPTVINLTDVLNKVCMLAEYSYRLRVDYVKAPSFVDDEG